MLIPSNHLKYEPWSHPWTHIVVLNTGLFLSNSILFRKYLLVKTVKYINFLLRRLTLIRYFFIKVHPNHWHEPVSFLFGNMINKFKHLTLQNKQFFLLKNSLAHQYHNLCNVSKYAGIPKENFSIDLSVFRCINVHSLLCNAELIVGGVQS